MHEELSLGVSGFVASYKELSMYLRVLICIKS